MPAIIRSVRGRYSSEKIIEKSRFLSYCDHVASEGETRAFIAEIKAMHPAATHHCYGFIADKTGAMQRFSDDGEPQGTAGMPILDVIKNKGLYETAVVVVRYFGGIKLGAGGLVRAYSSACAEVLDGAEICLWQPAAKYTVCVDYPQAEAALRFFAARGLAVSDAQYTDKVRYALSMPAAAGEAFVRELTDALAGRVSVCKTGEAFEPFPLEK